MDIPIKFNYVLSGRGINVDGKAITERRGYHGQDLVARIRLDYNGRKDIIIGEVIFSGMGMPGRYDMSKIIERGKQKIMDYLRREDNIEANKTAERLMNPPKLRHHPHDRNVQDPKHLRR